MLCTSTAASLPMWRRAGGGLPRSSGQRLFSCFFWFFLFCAGGIRQPYGIINYPVRSSGRPYVKIPIFPDARATDGLDNRTKRPHRKIGIVVVKYAPL